MEDHYTPKSAFVGRAASGDLPLTGSELAEANLRRLIAFTRDPDKSNRDWATLALGLYAPDTAEVRAALLLAADDEDADVRAEAIEALAERDPALARPFVERDLSRVPCGYGVFVAAGLIADPALVDALEEWDFDTDEPWIDNVVRDALNACRSGKPHDPHAQCPPDPFD